MCGIAGVYVKNPDSRKMPSKTAFDEFVNKLLLEIESRGRDATGIVSTAFETGKGRIEKEDIPASQFVYWRDPIIENTQIVLAHTRLATKGLPSDPKNNHPVQYGSVFVTHNGVIANDDELFKDEKIRRYAEVDTEIIPALIFKNGFSDTAKVLSQLKGAFAIAAIDPKNNPGELFLAKGPRSPLEVFETKSAIVWASTRTAIREAFKDVLDYEIPWKDFKSLSDGDILHVKSGDERATIGRFEVARTQYRSYGSEDYSGYPHSSHYAGDYPSEADKETYCTCNHKRRRHAGIRDDGVCLETSCKCTAFIRSRIQHGDSRSTSNPVERTSTPSATMTSGRQIRDAIVVYLNRERFEYVTCPECRDIFEKKDMIHDMKSKYYMCVECIKKSPLTEVRQQAGRPNLPLLPAAPPQVTEDLEDEEDKDSDVSAAPKMDLTGFTSAEAMFVELSKRIGLTAARVKWVYTLATDRDFDQNPSLINEYCLIDDTKAEIQQEYERQRTSDKDDSGGEQARSRTRSSAAAGLRPRVARPSTGKTESDMRGTEDGYGACGVAAFFDDDVPEVTA